MKSYLTKSGIKTLDWPGNIPNLNAIQNFWHIMVTKTAAKKPATQIKLQKSILRVWFHDIAWDYNQKLISSMPDCKAVIAARGGSTKD